MGDAKLNFLTRKLENFARLDDEDRQLLDEIAKVARRVPANTNIISEGDAPSDVHLILEGFACRSKLSSDGVRQIMAYLVPGDFCDLHVAILQRMDHSITTLSSCLVVDIPIRTVESMTMRPKLARALWWATLVDEGTLREWLVNLGARDAKQKISHLFCELLIRLRSVGLASEDEYLLPITQRDLADTVGLSSVHVNRVLQSLRADGLIEFESKVMSIRSFTRLAELSKFNSDYLHLSNGDVPRNMPHN